MVDWVDADDINLTGRLLVVVVVRAGVVVVVRARVVVCARVVVRASVVHLRPTKARNASVDFMNEETIRIEPRLGETLGKDIVVPITLLGVIGKCASVYRQPFVVVDTWSKCARGEPVRGAMSRVKRQIAAHQQQWNIDVKAMTCGVSRFGIRWIADEPADRSSARGTYVGNCSVEFTG